MTLALGIVVFLLWMVVLPRAISRAALARENAARHDLRVLSSALENFRLDCERYPTTDEGLSALRTQPPNCVGWNGPYLQDWKAVDPWGNPYHYESPAAGSEKTTGENSFLVESYGADGRPGGTGHDADIVARED